MTSFSEKSYGARFHNAQNILTYVESFPGYSSPDLNESPAEFAALLDSIAEANGIESELKQQYRAAVHARKEGFRGEGTSILRLLPMIRAAVVAKFGKDSQEYEAVSSIINRIYSTKLTPPPPADPTATPGSDPQQGISRSQQSYGSMLGYFRDLISTLGQLSGYAPSNALLTVTSLNAFADSLDALNKAVAQRSQSLQKQRKERLALYEDMATRVQKIKAYVKAQYGQKSQQFGAVKGVVV